MITPIIVPMKVSVSDVQIPVSVSASDVALPVRIGVGYYTSQYDEYTGATEFTPSDEPQIIQTAERVVMTDIVINPVPSNYGRITYNGSTITVW